MSFRIVVDRRAPENTRPRVVVHVPDGTTVGDVLEKHVRPWLRPGSIRLEGVDPRSMWSALPPGEVGITYPPGSATNEAIIKHIEDEHMVATWLCAFLNVPWISSYYNMTIRTTPEVEATCAERGVVFPWWFSTPRGAVVAKRRGNVLVW